ncbi:MAG: hypothetical protein ACUVT6_13505 [Thermodesulfobacteriota bacterium]
MNPCRRYEQSLILYSHQELGGKKVVTLQKHLSQCERCRTYLDELNRVFQVIKTRDASTSDPNSDFGRKTFCPFRHCEDLKGAWQSH